MYYQVTQNKLKTFESYYRGEYKANIRQPLKRGQRPRSQSVLCSELLLYTSTKNKIVLKDMTIARKMVCKQRESSTIALEMMRMH